jgi:hypothetical protein
MAMKPIILRTKLSYSIFSILNLAVILGLMLTIIVIVQSVAWRVALIALSYLATFLFLDRTLLRLRRNRIILDETGLRASQEGGQVQVAWDDVEAVWQPEAVGKIGILRMTTASGTRQVYLGTYDKARTWEVIRQFMPPAALQADTYKEVAIYAEFRSVLQELFAGYQFPLVTNHGGARFIAWIGVIVLAPLSVTFARAGLWVFVPFYAVSALISLVYLMAVGTTKLDIEGVTHHAWFRKYRMRWADITEVESSPLDTWMILRGEGKKLALPGIRLWSGLDRGRMLSLYMYILAENAIQQRETQWADLKLLNTGTHQHRGNRASDGESRVERD